MKGYGKRKSSTSSEEALSAILAEKDGIDLYECKVFICDFCDEAFLNRYNYLVHNATHIIIPLIKVTYFKCQQCQLQCPSDRQLRKHMKKYHPNIIILHHKEIKDSQSEDAQVTINNNVNNLTVINSNNNEEFLKVNHTDNLSKNSNDIIEIIDSDNEEFAVVDNLDNRQDRMRNRLVFEDDEEDIINPNGLMFDLTSDIKVNVPLEPWMTCITEDTRAVKNVEVPKEIDPQMEDIWKSKTISYQQLTDMEDVACEYCKKTFPNRLSQIEHQNVHITSKKRHPFLCAFCDWYVSSDPQTLRKHHKRKHPDKDINDMKSVQRPSCKLCKLRYISKQKHMKNYHSEMDSEDAKLDDTNLLNDTKVLSVTKLLDDNKPQFIKKTTKVCDLCISFLKNKPNNIYYKKVGEESISGQRQTCARCMKQFFSINIVEILTRHKFMGQRKPKPISNVERLKNFQNRLKMLNTIRKF